MIRPVRVVMAADDGFARPLAVAGRSLISNLGADVHLDLYVLDMGLTPANRSAVRASLASPQVSLEFIGAKGKVDHLPIPSSFTWTSTAVYARLLIPELLPESLNRVVYLDCDIVVRRCIADLYEADMSGKVALAVQDMVAGHVSSPPWGLADWYEAGRSPGDLNFNSGIMVMDLDTWREEKIGQQALTYVQSYRFWRMVDQEGINAVAGRRIGPVDPRWNQQAVVFDDQFARFLPYSQRVIDQLRTDPWIVHYTGETKPWANAWDHPWTAEWYRYLDETKFSGWRPPRVGDPEPAGRRRSFRPAGLRLPRRKRKVEPWSFHAESGAKAGLSHRSPNGVRIMIGVLGKHPWDIQANLAQPGIEAGRFYRLECELKADRVRTAIVGVARSGEDWGGLGLYQTVDLSPRWRRLTYTFRASDTAAFSRVHFDLGTDTAHVDIRNVSLLAVDQVGS